MTIILSYNIDGDIHQSVVMKYDLNYTDQTIRENSTKFLSPLTYGFNTFRVTSMELLATTGVLMMAVENFGVCLYSLETDKMLFEISVIKEMRYTEFKVRNMVVQDASNIYLVMNKLGVLKVSILNETDYSIQSFFNFLPNEVAITSLVGKHP